MIYSITQICIIFLLEFWHFSHWVIPIIHIHNTMPLQAGSWLQGDQSLQTGLHYRFFFVRPEDDPSRSKPPTL